MSTRSRIVAAACVLALILVPSTSSGSPVHHKRRPACTDANVKTTGGGFLLRSDGAKQTFGFVAGLRSGVPFGHTEFDDHATGQHVEGDVVTYSPTPIGTGGTWSGPATVNGQPAGSYRVLASDQAEPGRGKDTFSIQVEGAGIDTAGPIEGGNIQQGC